MQKDFSYSVKVADLNQQEQHFKIQADENQLKILKEILKINDVKKFQANICLKLNARQHCLDVWGEVEAELEQTSVISLENFIEQYKVPFTYHFDTKATYRDIKDMEAGINDDVPDIIENGEVDLVGLAVEQLALVMDDYPRKKGEVFSFPSEFDDEAEKENPFAVLQKLKK